MRKVQRLYEGFQPENYNLYIDPDRDSKKISGKITVTGLKKGRPSQRITFHQNGLKITSATVIKHDKKGDHQIAISRISHQNTLNEVRLHSESLIHSGKYTITMEYQGKITDSTHGVYPCNYQIDGQDKALIATDLESHSAREVMPCIDEPQAKATFELTLASPVNEAAISNTPAKSQTEENGKLITAFEKTPKMSTYLFCFVYGDMQFKEATTKGNVAVRIWSTKAHSETSLDFSLDVAKKGIEFFNEYYGVDYPLAKCDFVALPDFSAAAMENWGLITFREPFLVAEPSTSSQSSREVTATVITHELSHQWFGDLVTMKWWNDLWLNESFANVMEYLAADAIFPEWHSWNTFTAQEGLAALRRDSITGVQAVKTEVRHPDEIGTLFDPSIVYAKGGRLINMLMRYIGEDDFRKGLKLYFDKHAYGNTTGDDLWAALSAASNKDVAGLMNPWLERSGYPVIHVEQNGKSLKISQEHFQLSPDKVDKERLWPVPLLSSSKELPTLLEKRELELELKNDDFIRVNDGAVGHYIVHYTNPKHAAYIAGLVDDQKLSEAERLMLLNDASMLAKAGIQSFAVALELLKHYKSESSESVWGMIAGILADCRRFIDANPELEKSIKLLVSQLIESEYQRLGFEEKHGENSQDTKLRATILALGVYAGHKAITRQALALFKAYQDDPDVVPSELRSVIFGAAVRNDVAGAVDFLLAIDEKTSNVDLKDDVQAALTSTHSVENANKFLARLKDPKKVRQHDVYTWMAYLMFNRYTKQRSWQWMRDNWAWIEKNFSDNKSFDYFPRYSASAFNTRQQADEYKEFFTPLRHWTSLTRNI
ncbi:MAG TPA: M1 family metallopeptidase, partial [Patescibacteria group bacterium]|nr:M1 family metallopeptidase [Patescibacteria group bacterium]